MSLKCISILAARLTDADLAANPPNVGSEIKEPGDPEAYYETQGEFATIETVGKLRVEQSPVWDEGEHRIIYIEHTVTLECILTSDMDFGDYVDGTNDPSSLDFSTRLANLARVLNTQGIALNFGGFPSPIRNMMPGNDINSQYAGWLIDNFNGPKPLSTTYESVSGSDSVILNYQIKYKTSYNSENAASGPLRPKISAELRMDIDKQGDIMFMLDGTIYADRLEDLYFARNYLFVEYMPATVNGLVDPNQQPYNSNSTFSNSDRWAQINGFDKDVTFNVEKNGRSARFSVKYTQIKSNNAHPLGLRDVRFTQRLESSLLNANEFQGAAFRTWKCSFKGQITLPPRFPARYAYYIYMLLVNQQMKLSQIKFDTKVKAIEDAEAAADPNATLESQELEAGKKIRKRETVTRAFPFAFMIEHEHFARTLKFETDYVLICPLSKVITASCVLDRVNNDYERRAGTNPDPNYIPIPLSQQWLAYNRSVDSAYAFDPTQTNAQNPGSFQLPHRDVAGIEIRDTGHFYDPYASLSAQNIQKALLISTTFDPNENDPIYQTSDETSPGAEQTDVELPKGGGGDYKTPANNDFRGVMEAMAGIIKPGTIERSLSEVDPEMSWIAHRQEYELLERNPTVPTESLSPVVRTEDHYTNKSQYDSLGLDGTVSESEILDATTKDTGFKFAGRTNPSDYEGEDPGGSEPFVRRTYSAKPTRIYVKVKGYAIRVKYKVPIPSLLQIAGERAIRVGDGRARHKNLAPDADVPIYVAMWEQVYTVDKNININDIVNEDGDILAGTEDGGASIAFV